MVKTTRHKNIDIDQINIFDAGLADDVLGHGGKRSGAGRPKSLPIPSKTIRVSGDLAIIFKAISDKYQDANTTDKIDMLQCLLKKWMN